MKNLYLLSLIIVLFISGCVGKTHGPGEGMRMPPREGFTA